MVLDTLGDPPTQLVFKDAAELVDIFPTFAGDELISDPWKEAFNLISAARAACERAVAEKEKGASSESWAPDLASALDSLKAIKEADSDKYCSTLLEAAGWAGSGFRAEPDLVKVTTSLDHMAKGCFLTCKQSCLWAHFNENGKAMLDAKVFNKIKVLAYTEFYFLGMSSLVKNEEDVKNTEEACKEALDMVKALMTQVKATLSTAQKQAREVKRQSLTASLNEEKEQARMLKQKDKEEKNRLKQIATQMKGSDKLPGLLAYCGEWIKPMRCFQDPS
eukprot:6838042-Alexandrium_andersonii.AAC.1